MFEISHADLLESLIADQRSLIAAPAVSTLCGSCDPPTYRCFHQVFAVKNLMFGNQNIFKDRKNGSWDCFPFATIFFAVN
jgi:hypothetical protein